MTVPRRLSSLPSRELPDGLHLAEATGFASRLLGLALLDPIPEDWALHFPRCSSLHTFWMRFPLDLVWLDGDGRVLRIDEAVPKRRTKACRGAKSVIETRSGHGRRFAGALDV